MVSHNKKSSVLLLLIILIFPAQIFCAGNESQGMGSMSKIHTLWNKLFEHQRKRGFDVSCSGATSEQLDSLINSVKCEIPKSLIESLTICSDEKAEGSYGWIDIYNADLINEFYTRKHLYPEWNVNWIQIYDYDSDYVVYIDMTEGSSKKGQVFCLEAFSELPAKMWVNSYEEWLEIMVNEIIEHDQIRYELFEMFMAN